MNVLQVPLHKIVLHSDLFQSEIAVCVRPALRVKGVTLILGNGAAGGHVWGCASPPPVVSYIVPTMNQFIALFGIPKIIQTNQGSNFTSHWFLQVL